MPFEVKKERSFAVATRTVEGTHGPRQLGPQLTAGVARTGTADQNA